MRNEQANVGVNAPRNASEIAPKIRRWTPRIGRNAMFSMNGRETPVKVRVLSQRIERDLTGTRITYMVLESGVTIRPYVAYPDELSRPTR